MVLLANFERVSILEGLLTVLFLFIFRLCFSLRLFMFLRPICFDVCGGDDGGGGGGGSGGSFNGLFVGRCM